MGKQMIGVLRVLDKLKNPEEHGGYFEADNGISQTKIIMRVLNLTPPTKKYTSYKTGETEERPYYGGLKLGSALIGTPIGARTGVLNFVGSVMAARFVLEDPTMKDDPLIKRHFDWADKNWEGRKKADKKYASFSRSIKLLLDADLITVGYHADVVNPYHRRSHRARYIITDKGREYLSSTSTS